MFTQHFQGSYRRPNTYTDLIRYVQKPEETTTQFLARWIQTKASRENVDDNQAIHAFTRGLLKGSILRHRLVREQVNDLGSMLEIASKYAQEDDDARMAKALQIWPTSEDPMRSARLLRKAEPPMKLPQPLKAKAASGSGRPRARMWLRQKLI